MNKLIYMIVFSLICSGFPYNRLIKKADVNTTTEVTQNTNVESVQEVTEPTPTPVVESEPVVAEETPTVEAETPKAIPLGVCKLTAYCKENYPHICNNGDSSYTATGTTPTVGRTVAVDPSLIPYGSEVIINGHTYIAEDCGGSIKGNRIDILFATHREALNFGIQYAEVYYIPKEAA